MLAWQNEARQAAICPPLKKMVNMSEAVAAAVGRRPRKNMKKILLPLSKEEKNQLLIMRQREAYVASLFVLSPLCSVPSHVLPTLSH